MKTITKLGAAGTVLTASALILTGCSGGSGLGGTYYTQNGSGTDDLGQLVIDGNNVQHHEIECEGVVDEPDVTSSGELNDDRTRIVWIVSGQDSRYDRTGTEMIILSESTISLSGDAYVHEKSDTGKAMLTEFQDACAVQEADAAARAKEAEARAAAEEKAEKARVAAEDAYLAQGGTFVAEFSMELTIDGSDVVLVLPDPTSEGGQKGDTYRGTISENATSAVEGSSGRTIKWKADDGTESTGSISPSWEGDQITGIYLDGPVMATFYESSSPEAQAIKDEFQALIDHASKY